MLAISVPNGLVLKYLSTCYHTLFLYVVLSLPAGGMRTGSMAQTLSGQGNGASGRLTALDDDFEKLETEA